MIAGQFLEPRSGTCNLTANSQTKLKQMEF